MDSGQSSKSKLDVTAQLVLAMFASLMLLAGAMTIMTRTRAPTVYRQPANDSIWIPFLAFNIGIVALAFFLSRRWPAISSTDLEATPHRFANGRLFFEVLGRNTLTFALVAGLYYGFRALPKPAIFGSGSPWFYFSVFFCAAAAITVLNHILKLRLGHPSLDLNMVEPDHERLPGGSKAIALIISVLAQGGVGYLGVKLVYAFPINNQGLRTGLTAFVIGISIVVSSLIFDFLKKRALERPK